MRRGRLHSRPKAENEAWCRRRESITARDSGKWSLPNYNSVVATFCHNIARELPIEVHDPETELKLIHVDDVVSVNLWFLEHGGVSGIFNLGTGRSQTFNEVASAVIRWHGRGRIRYIPFPDDLRDSYQSFTEADLSGLRAAGYAGEFMAVEEGVQRYLDTLAAREA